MNTRAEADPQVISETKFLRFVDRGGWSYVERTKSNGVVCIVARTRDDRILLVEQYRPPVNCNVIELPSGLSGDLTDLPDEPLENAARRELLEETGYEAKHLRQAAVVTSSAGLTSEVVTLFIADELEKVAEGGGDESENITVHEIPVNEINDWLHQAQTAGKLIGSRVFAGLYLLDANPVS